VTSIASTVSSTTSTTFCLATREAEQKLYDSTPRGNHPSYRGKYGPSIYAPALTRTGTIMWRPRSSPAFTASRSVYADRQYDGVTMSYASKLGKSGAASMPGAVSAVGKQTLSNRKNTLAASFGVGDRDLWDSHARLYQQSSRSPCRLPCVRPLTSCGPHIGLARAAA